MGNYEDKNYHAVDGDKLNLSAQRYCYNRLFIQNNLNKHKMLVYR